MIRHILDFLDHAKLARIVILQTRQLDHLDRLCAHLQDALDIAETTAEEYRSRIPPPRDARSTEAEVLSVCHAWAKDAEQTARAQLNRAEVELAMARAEIASLRRELAAARRSDDTHDTAEPPRTLPSRPHPEMACTGTEGGAE
jgi:septal ring factor EnvC (AmiA/AmiB activator)